MKKKFLVFCLWTVVHANASLAGNYDIGVLPNDSGFCPKNTTSRIWIYMDDEDSKNANYRRGWISNVVSNRNTTMYFCKVDGSSLRPRSFNDSRLDFAVLKLGRYCPNGSYEFGKDIDNEDDDNKNRNSGGIWPNSQDRNTRLRFCMFQAGRGTVSYGNTWPSLGGGTTTYGVFAPNDFWQYNSGKGSFSTDDEDNNNQNFYINGNYRTNRIISAGRNTSFQTMQVKWPYGL